MNKAETCGNTGHIYAGVPIAVSKLCNK